MKNTKAILQYVMRISIFLFVLCPFVVANNETNVSSNQTYVNQSNVTYISSNSSTVSQILEHEVTQNTKNWFFSLFEDFQFSQSLNFWFSALLIIILLFFLYWISEVLFWIMIAVIVIYVLGKI